MRTLPDVVTEEMVGDQLIRRDEAGYLVDSDDWNDEIAIKFAAEEGVTLGDDHWAVLRFMREYQVEHGISADARFTFRFLAELHDESESKARRRFFELFPYGYVKQACKIAGMKQPRAWSTG